MLLPPCAWQKFLLCLSCNSPVCGYIHLSPELKEILVPLSNDITRSPTNLQVLQENFPVLFHLIKSEGKVNKCLSPIIDVLLEKCENPFKHEPFQLPPNDVSNQLSYFPNYPKIRCRGYYNADNKRKGHVCTKKGFGHPSLLPGIFTIYCQHGVCLGFEVMEVHESPNTAFTILTTRFEKAPDVIIYDNACNLHAYCLNRNPKFFQKTRFLVDRFHWPNHTGCMLVFIQYIRISSIQMHQ